MRPLDVWLTCCSPLSSKRIGLTGARGVLATTIRDGWPGWDLRLCLADVRDYAAVRDWVASNQPLEAVLHLAAVVPTQRVDADPHSAFLANVMGTCNLLEAIRHETVRPWIFVASTSHVYRSSDTPLTEESPLEPISLYGKTKRMAEEWAAIYAEKYGLPVCVGRIFSYTSPLQPQAYLIPSLFHRLAQASPGASLEIAGLAGSRDFLTAEEVSRVIRQLLDRKACGILNIASGQRLPLQVLAEAIREKLNRSDVVLTTSGGESHLGADVSRLRALGIEPRFELAELLTQGCARPENSL